MRSLRSFALTAAFALLLGLSYQFFSYRQFTFEATWIAAKATFGMQTRQDRFSMSQICWELKRYHCAEQNYREWAMVEPSNLVALSGLAKTLTVLRHESDALPYFRAYFAAAGRDSQIMWWYAKALLATGSADDSVQ